MMIDFDKIDQKKVTILCKHPENNQVLIDFLKSKQFEIQVEKTPGDFFQSVTKMKPGIVMISHEMNDLMGKVFPNFIHKRFKIPVLLFHELHDKKSPVVNHADASGSPAIRSLQPSTPEKIHKEIEAFQQNYNDALLEYSRPDINPSAVNLRAQRIERQEKVFKKITDNLSTGGFSVIDVKEQLQMLSVKVVDPSGHGSFLFFTELPPGTSMEAFQEQLKNDLALPGEDPLVMEPLNGKISQELYQRLKENSDKTLQGKWGDNPVSVLYYVDSEVENQEDIVVTEDGYLVPVEAWWTQIPLTFNAHIWLQLNDRKILYIRRGDLFNSRNVGPFVAKAQKILVKGEEFQAFQQMAELISLVSPKASKKPSPAKAA